MDKLSVSPALGSRPDSMVSCMTSASWSTESSSRPTSYGSDTPPTATQPQRKSDDVREYCSASHSSSDMQEAPSDRARRPGHALMRLRRISMPTSALPRTEMHAAKSRQEPTSQALIVPHNRFSVASARSCDSLPEEAVEALDDATSPSLEQQRSKILHSAIPLPTRRIRLKSTRRQSTSPSGLPQGSASREGSAGSRPVSLALPTTSALVASSSNGQAFVRESQTLKRSLTSNNGSSASPKSSPGKGKPSVTFSLAEPTRSIISARDFNTAKRNARMAKKDRIANEILQTERVYVSVLNEIQEHYIAPLTTPRSASKATSSQSSSEACLSPRTMKEIFSNFGDIHNLNKEILRRLEESISAAPVSISQSTPSPAQTSLRATGVASPPRGIGSIRAYQPTTLPVPRNIGTILAPILPFLKCYSLFVGNFGNAQAILEREEKTNEAWKIFLAEKKAQRIGKGLSLTAMLLCIVQRIPRYRLLLGDLLRFTDPNDPDYKPLKKAIIAVEEVAEHLEVSIKQHEISVAMLDLQRSFIGLNFQLIAPGRRLIKSGVLVKQGRRADEERAFFLFTDILIYADIIYAWSLPGLSNSGGGHSAAPSAASERLPVSVIWPTRGLPAALAEGSAQYTFKQFFELEDLTVTSAAGQVFEIRSPVQSFCLVAATPEMKHEWVAALREAKEELLKSRRTLLTEEEEKKRSRLRRLSMPVPPPLAERSLFNTSAYSSTGLVAQSTVTSALPSPTGAVFPTDWDIPDHFSAALDLQDAQESLGDRHVAEISKETSSHRSSYSSHAKYQNLKVYEDYSAPIWVPDSRTSKCMRCGEMFALWRRRHHCRLCGDVVCWACSTKSFAIPSSDGKGSHIIGRACDECYETCFTHTPEAERNDPLGCSVKSSESSYSLLESLNPLRPLMTRAVSLYEMASSPSRSREGSLEVESPDRSRRSSQLGSSTPESVALLKTVLGS